MTSEALSAVLMNSVENGSEVMGGGAATEVGEVIGACTAAADEVATEFLCTTM